MTEVRSHEEQAQLIADAQARERAVDPNRSIILQAPAGSGKTTVLIERLLRLLARADSPEEILAITFTRKAAAEMALRVAEVLKLDATTAHADPRTQRLAQLAEAVRLRSVARGWRLAENPGRLRIQTLDSLNRALAVQLPLAAGGRGSLEVLPQARSAYRAAARRALLDAQGDAILEADVQLLFERMENDFGRCELLIATMLEKRTHWLPYLTGDAAVHLPARVRESLAAVVAARLARARHLVPETLLQEGLALGRATARHLQTQAADAGPWCEFLDARAPATAQGVQLHHWQGLANLALTNTGHWRKRLDVRLGYPPQDKDLKVRGMAWILDLAAQRGVLDLFTEIQVLPDPHLSADETEVLGVIARLLQLAAAELTVVFGELGRVDYPAIAAAAREALGSVEDPSDLALRLDNRIRHILVDEFQDTSLEQTGLLVLLTAGWAPEDGRTLFLVGDPMQSIYGFREAEVGMFLGARSAGIGTVPLEPLALRCNFRSTAEVVAWNNEVFARCFPEVDDPRTSSVAYSRSIAGRAHGVPGAVRLHRLLPGDTAGEARSIAQTITQLRAMQPDVSIAVLVAARRHAAPIVAALEAQQIPVSGVDLVSLEELSIVRDLAALTQALDHLADRTAWLAILRAPWCGLTLLQLTQLAGTDRHVTLWERLGDPEVLAALPQEARGRLQRLRAALGPSLTGGGSELGVARRVEAAWLRLGGPAACSQEVDLVHARAFFDALEQWSQEPDWSGPQELAQRLERLYAAHQAGIAGAVQIMTIHHAKGLEFDHVLLPGLGRRGRGNERQLLQWLDLPRGTSGSDLLMVAVPPAAAAGVSALGRYVTRLQAQRQHNEATRLLYVAATRARRQLHLFAQLADPVEGKPLPAPHANTPLERLWPAIRTQFPPVAEVCEATALPQPDAASRPVGTLLRLVSGWQLPVPQAAPQPIIVPIASYEPAAQPTGTLVDRAVCEVLRSLARRRRLPGPDEASLVDQVSRRLQNLGCSAARLEADVAQGLGWLQACLADSRLQWIFASLGTPDAQAEVPLELTGMFAGRLTSIQADLSFKDPRGTRWLIDIAPSPLNPHDGVDATFAVRLARHVELAQALDGAPARAAVYLPATQLFLEGSGQGEGPPPVGIR